VGALLLLTLRGTPTWYYGDELGMENVAIPPDLVQDPWEKGVPGIGLGRDPVRTPMQWDAGPGAGFTTGTPWLPLAPDYQTHNVAVADADPASMLRFVRAVLALRRAQPALTVGSYRSLDAGNAHVFAYLREAAGTRLLVVLNLSDDAQLCALPDPGGTATILLSTHGDRAGTAALSALTLRPAEGLLLQCDATLLTRPEC
jgi:alpha-glucosidase